MRHVGHEANNEDCGISGMVHKGPHTGGLEIGLWGGNHGNRFMGVRMSECQEAMCEES